ncbi:MAG TPA: hypothetical protein VMH92_13825 [Acidocella sp.]|nr:hypothetical protein [Acidocella sp.]
MRSIWLASAALILGVGVACAQPMPPTPPTGPASMPATPPSAMTPPGSAAPAANAPPSTMMKPHGGTTGMMRGPLPADASPDVYLQIAKTALAHHDSARADDALGHAETRLLTRTVIQGPAIPQDNSPAVTDIEQARQALQAHDFATAMQKTDAALQALPPPGGAAMAPPPSAQ